MFNLRSGTRGAAQRLSALRETLSGGDRRSIGAADEVAELIERDARQFADAFALMSDADAVVCGRAADAVEKASRARPALLAPHKVGLLALLVGTEDSQVRWHVLQMVSRLALSPDERRSAYAIAEQSLSSDSRIIAVEALSAMFALAANDPPLREQAVAAGRRVMTLKRASALQARARGLLWKHAGVRIDDKG